MTPFSAAPRPGPRLAFTLSPAAAAKSLAALLLGSLGVYLLHVGRRDRDIRRMALAAAFFFGALALFSL